MRAAAHCVVSQIAAGDSKQLLAGLHFVARHHIATKWPPAKNALDSYDEISVAKNGLDVAHHCRERPPWRSVLLPLREKVPRSGG